MKNSVGADRWNCDPVIEKFDFTDCSNEQLLIVANKQCVNLKSAVRCNIETANIDEDAVVIIFRPHLGIEFCFSAHLTSTSLERRNYTLNQWASCMVVFVRAFEYDSTISGSCQLWLDDRPRRPGIAFSGNTVSHFCIPDPSFLSTFGYRDARHSFMTYGKPWDERISMVVWRGATTGTIPPYTGVCWRDLPRLRMCLQVRKFNQPYLFDVGISQIVQMYNHNEIEDIIANNLLLPPIPASDFMKYQYALDIDGNSNSWPGLFSKLIFNNTTLKVDGTEGFRQWYYERLMPWCNFVPISANCEEMAEVAKWLIKNPKKSKEIADAGNALSKELTWSSEVEKSALALLSYVRSNIAYIYPCS